MDKIIKKAIAEIWEGWGYKVDYIKESDQKSPDLFVKNGEEKYYIEIKQKEDDASRIRHERVKLKKGEIVSHSDNVGYKNRISGLIRAAQKQLDVIKDKAAFKIIWIYCAGEDYELQMNQCKYTLYGMTRIYDFSKGADIHAYPCYYFYNSEFYRGKNVLDGAMISGGDEGQFLINNYSKKYDNVKKTNLFNIIGKGVVDPLALEEKKEAYIADCNIDRNKKDLIINYLQNKYLLDRIMNIDFGMHKAKIIVDNE